MFLKSFFSSVLLVLSLAPLAFAAELPQRPQNPENPGSASYLYQMARKTISFNQRKIEVYLPVDAQNASHQFPVLVYGHGQAIDITGYDSTFSHLAQKGIAVVFPQFDTGFFDQDWARMANDFNLQTAEVLKQLGSQLDARHVVYSGHSKGAYVSLVAAGSASLNSQQIQLGAVVLFAPAGYDKTLIAQINPNVPVTLIWGEGDTVIKKSLVDEIYQNLTVKKKQFILVKNYEQLTADHFFPLSKSFFFGGQDGISAYHFFGSWKWMIGAVQDLTMDQKTTNKYLYGDEAQTSGVDQLNHQILRSWN